MAQIDYLRKKVKYHVKDVDISDDDLDGIIETTMEDISLTTKVFKKIYGFTVHKDINLYDFRYLARLNEEVEYEPSKITLTDPSSAEIIDFLATGSLPSPGVEKELEQEKAQSRFIDLLEVFDEMGRSILDKFEYRGSTSYFVYDQAWLEEHDGAQMAFTAWVVPMIDELHDEDLLTIMPTVIAGSKFFVMDSLHSVSDVQATNYDFMRYYQAKDELRNMFPTAIITNTIETKDNRWP